MATASKLLTYEEWLQLPTVEDGTDEVVKGEYRFMPPTHYPHAEIIQLLISQLVKQTDSKKVSILGSNFGLMITREPLTCRSPDLVVYWRDRIVLQDGLYCSPPDLIVEIISPSESRPRKEGKMEDYASIGVPEVWLVSPQAQSIEVRMLKDGKLERTGIFLEGSLQPSRFPGVTIHVKGLWPEE